MYRCLYPVRATELPWIKRRRLKEFKSVLGQEPAETESFELTTYEFLMMSSMYQLNLNYLTSFLDLMVLHGGVVVCMAYIIFTLVVGMPLYMLFTFMSSYSKKACLKFWDCSPLFEGLGYSLAFMRLTTEIYNTSLVGICMLLIPDVFNPQVIQKIANCDFGDSRCIPIKTIENHTATCNNTHSDSHEMKFTATQYYVRYYALKFTIGDKMEAPLVNTKWLLTLAITWVIVFVVGIHGIKRIRRITVNLQLIFISILIGISIIALLNMDHQQRTTYSGKSADALFEFRFWTDIIVHSAETNVLCNIIWLGTLKPKSLRPKCAGLITTLIKLLLMVALICFSSRVIQQTLKFYKISDENCLNVTGFDVLFILVPDILYRTHIPGLLILLWYTSLMYYCFIAPLYTVIGLVDAITQKFEALHKYRLCVYLVLCIIGFLGNLPLILNSGLYTVKIWRFNGMPMLTSATLLLVVLAICFVYSTKQVMDDYTFTYGTPPDKYWAVFWETSPIFAIFAFIFVLDQIAHNEKMSSELNIIKSLSYCQCMSVLLPVFVIILARCFRHITFRTLSDLSKSADSWGPYQSHKMESRKHYYPHRNMKCLNPVLKCNHRCIVRNNLKYMGEVEKQAAKIETLKTLVQKYTE